MLKLTEGINHLVHKPFRETWVLLKVSCSRIFWWETLEHSVKWEEEFLDNGFMAVVVGIMWLRDYRLQRRYSIRMANRWSIYFQRQICGNVKVGESGLSVTLLFKVLNPIILLSLQSDQFEDSNNKTFTIEPDWSIDCISQGSKVQIFLPFLIPENVNYNIILIYPRQNYYIYKTSAKKTEYLLPLLPPLTLVQCEL